MGRVARITARVVVWTIAIALLIASWGSVATYLVLQTDWGRRQVADLAENELDDVLDGDVKIGEIRGDLFSSFSIRDVEVRDESGMPVIKVGRIDVAYDLEFGKLYVDQHVDVRWLRVSDVEVYAAVDEQGELNLAGLVPESEDEEEEEDEDTEPSPPTYTVAIPNVTVSNAAVTLATAGQPERHLSLDNVTADIDLGETGLLARITELRGAIDPGDGDEALALTAAGLVHQGIDGALLVGDTRVKVGDAKLVVRGAGADSDLAFVHALVQARIPVSVIDRFAPDTGVISGVDAVGVVARDGADAPYQVTWAAAAGATSAELVAAIDVERPSVTGTARVEGIDVSRLARDLPPTQGRATVHCYGEGTSVDDATGAVIVDAGGSAEGVSVSRVYATGYLRGGRAAYGVTGQVPSGNVQAAGVVDLTGDVPTVTGTASGDVRKLELAIGALVPVRGRASGRATYSGPIDDLAAHGSATLANIRYEDKRVPYGSVRFDLAGLPDHPYGTISFDARRVMVGADRMGRVVGTARVRDDGRRVLVSVTSLDPTATLKVRANADVLLEGDDIEVRMRRYGVDARGLGATGTGGHVSVTGGGDTRVRGIELTSKAGTISVEGVIGEDHMDVTIVAERINLTELSRTLEIDPPVHGIVSINGRIDQRGRRVAADGTVTARDVRREGMKPKVDSDLTVALENGVLDVRGTTTSRALGTGTLHARMRAPRDPMDADGWMRRREEHVLASSLVVTGVDLATLPLEGPDAPTAGRANLDLQIADGVATASLTVDGSRVALPRLVGTIAPRLVVAVDGRQIDATLTSVTSRGEKARLEATAYAPAALSDVDAWRRAGDKAVGRVEVRGGPVDFQRLVELGAPPSEQRGTVSVSATIAPGLASADSELTIRSRKPKGRVIETVLRVSSHHRARDVDGSISLLIAGTPYVIGSGTLAIGLDHLENGELDEIGAAKVSADLTASTLPMSLIGDLIDSPERLIGAVSGTGELRGSLDQPIIIATFDGSGMGTAQVRFDKLTAGGRVTKTRFVGEVLAEQRKGGTLLATATGSLDATKDDLNASVVAHSFDLAFLRGVLPELGIGGEVEANLTAKGNREKPAVVGTASLSGGTVRPGEPLRIIDGLSGKLSISPTVATLEVTGRAGRGDLSVDARADIRDNAPVAVDLTLKMKDLPVEAGGQLVSVETRTTVKGRLRGEVWNIDTRIGDTVVGLPKSEYKYLHELGDMDDVVFVDGGTPRKPKWARIVRKKPSAGPRAPSGVKVRVRAPSTITIRGQEAKAVVTVDLTYDGTKATPEILGTVRTESGWLELFGRRYQIERAIAAFSGPPDPSLDVRLVHDFSTMTMYVDVVGTADYPELRLSSDPAIYDDAQLLSFVLGGSPDSAQDEDRKLSGRALGIASSLVTDRVQTLVRDVLPIDVLRIELQDDSTNPDRMTVGKWLSNELFVAYRHRFEADENENSGEATLEYRFMRRWLFEAFFGDRGVGAADVVWVKRF